MDSSSTSIFLSCANANASQALCFSPEDNASKDLFDRLERLHVYMQDSITDLSYGVRFELKMLSGSKRANFTNSPTVI